MPFSSGTFSRVHDWTSDRDAGIKISASRTDAEFDGIATGLTSCILKDGTQTLTAMIPFTLGLSVPTDKKIQLRDSAIFINSSGDGELNMAADTSVTITTPSLIITDNTTDEPIVQIKNTHNGTTAGELRFVMDKGAAGADGDDLGTISFFGDDSGQNQTAFAKIVGEVSEADNTDEAGKLSFFVAESDGTNTALTAGLVLEGEHATDGEVDVTIGAGITSTTSVSGVLNVAGGAVFNEDSADVDFRIESDNDTHALFVNGENGHVSIGSANADYMGGSNTSGTLSLTVPSGGYSVFELAAEGADSANALAGTINFINTLQTGGNQLVNIRGTTEGGTSADRGGRFSVGTKADGGSTPIERMKLISTGFLKVRGGGGDYVADTGEYHEFIGTASGSMPVRVVVQNTSYVDHGFSVGCTRTSTNAYSLISAFHGNGSSDAFNDRVFTVTGQGEIASDHSTSITSGADYAEYFEWKDGNSSSEDRIGQSVVLDGNKIRKATSDDNASNILGVISGNPSVVGDTAELRWQGKYELDDFNRRKTEEVEVWEWTDPEGEVDEIGDKHPKFYSVHKDKVPDGVTVPSDKKVTKVTNDKESSSYDASKKDDYVPRSQRKEWDAVGLMGKLRMLKGQPTGDRWIKMRDISDTVEEWLVR